MRKYCFALVCHSKSCCFATKNFKVTTYSSNSPAVTSKCRSIIRNITTVHVPFDRNIMICLSVINKWITTIVLIIYVGVQSTLSNKPTIITKCKATKIGSVFHLSFTSSASTITRCTQSSRTYVIISISNRTTTRSFNWVHCTNTVGHKVNIGCTSRISICKSNIFSTCTTSHNKI